MPRPSTWRRISHFTMDSPYPQQSFQPGAVAPRGGRIYQGCPGDFFVVVALQALAMKPQLIANIFCNMEFSSPQLGLYTMRLYKHGQWQYIDVDDFIPLNADMSPCTCQTEFWPA